MNQIVTDYLNWMYNLVETDTSRKHSFKKLFQSLHDIEFVPMVELDANRASDGINMRWYYEYDHHIETCALQTILQDRPCSVLEMLIGLALRLEAIMDDPDKGNQVGRWFWDMLGNMGLSRMFDSHYDHNYICESVDRLINRTYEPDGNGGPFVLTHCAHDLRNVELWYQAIWYLDEIIERGE